MIALVRLCATALAAGLAPVAAADSADGGLCPENPSRLQRAMCADPELKETRDRMNARMAAVKRALSDRGAAQLAAGQQAWLTRTHRLCDERTDSSQPDLDERSRSCLALRYDLRSGELAHFIPKIGPYQFLYVTRFEDRGSVSADIGYLQIDSPLTAATERWNEQMAGWSLDACGAKVEDAEIDLSIDLSVTFAEPRFISATCAAEWRPKLLFHGGASDVKHSNRWLLSERELEAADLFDPATDWKGALQRAALRHLVEDESDVDWAEVVAKQAGDPAYWSILRQGLLIQFDYGNTYSFATAEIPWSDLRPYLVSPLPLALRLD
ncbi:MAG: DUF1311 domain-containing protein [Rhodospirillaceae bacterium]|nr:DUF1311 domain-containing protein [Rhodospirillaceae bacterium]